MFISYSSPWKRLRKRSEVGRRELIWYRHILMSNSRDRMTHSHYSQSDLDMPTISECGHTQTHTQAYRLTVTHTRTQRVWTEIQSLSHTHTYITHKYMYTYNNINALTCNAAGAFLFSPLTFSPDATTGVIFLKTFLHIGQELVTLLQFTMHSKQKRWSHAIFPLFFTSSMQIQQFSFSFDSSIAGWVAWVADVLFSFCSLVWSSLLVVAPIVISCWLLVVVAASNVLHY